MSQNLIQPSAYEDEIDLIKVFKIIIEYKKLIISTILIFTIASIIYSLSLKPSFKTSARLEIGYLENYNGETQLIESSSTLISDLKILLLKKNHNHIESQNVVINSLEGRVINLVTTSRSAEQNENVLNELINSIYERHDILSKSVDYKEKKVLTIDIESTETEITHLQKKLSDQTQSQYLEIIKGLDKETGATEIINLFNQNANNVDKVFVLNQKLIVLKENLEMLNSKIYSKTQLIGAIATETIKPKTLLIISLSLIFGFITGIFLAFVKNFLKSL